jgi:hypothetical protein
MRFIKPWPRHLIRFPLPMPYTTKGKTMKTRTVVLLSACATFTGCSAEASTQNEAPVSELSLALGVTSTLPIHRIDYVTPPDTYAQVNNRRLCVTTAGGAPVLCTDGWWGSSPTDSVVHYGQMAAGRFHRLLTWGGGINAQTRIDYVTLGNAAGIFFGVLQDIDPSRNPLHWCWLSTFTPSTSRSCLDVITEPRAMPLAMRAPDPANYAATHLITTQVVSTSGIPLASEYAIGTDSPNGTLRQPSGLSAELSNIGSNPYKSHPTCQYSPVTAYFTGQNWHTVYTYLVTNINVPGDVGTELGGPAPLLYIDDVQRNVNEPWNNRLERYIFAPGYGEIAEAAAYCCVNNDARCATHNPDGLSGGYLGYACSQKLYRMSTGGVKFTKAFPGDLQDTTPACNY